MTYLEACARGEATAADLIDYVERWHGGKGDGELWRFLGMTRAQYARVTENAAAIHEVIAEAKAGYEGTTYTQLPPGWKEGDPV